MLNNLNSLRMELRVMSTSDKGCELVLKEWVVVKIHRKGFETLIVISFMFYFSYSSTTIYLKDGKEAMEISSFIAHPRYWM